MNRPEVVDTISERLRMVAEAATVPAVAEQAQRLLSRLHSPVRVTLLGLPGAGKLQLLNALAAGPALPPEADRVTLELRYGTEEAFEITYSDGTVLQDTGPIEPDDLVDSALVVVDRPMAALRRISLLNLVASADPREQQPAIAWAARRTDIALWCSPSFGRADRLIWSQVPDRIKDHAYLVLTACGGEQAAEIKGRHRAEFIDVYAVDLSAKTDNGAENGVGELADRISYHADLGRRADTDSAMLFLRAQEPRKRSRPRPNTRPRDAAAEASVKTPVDTATVEAAPAPAGVPEPTPEVPRKTPPPTKAERALYGAGFGYLRDRGQGLLSKTRQPGGLSDDAVVAHCSETLTHLSDMLASHEETGQIADLADAVMEAESLVILLENEQGDEAAVDAVSILLQIRRDFEAGLAA